MHVSSPAHPMVLTLPQVHQDFADWSQDTAWSSRWIGHSFSTQSMMSNDVKLVMLSILRVQPTPTHCSHQKHMVCIPCLTPGRQSATSRKRRSTWRRNRRNDLLRVVHLGVFESTILSWQLVAIVENQWHLMGIVLPERNPNSKKLRLSCFGRLLSNLGLASKVNSW